MVGAYDGFLGPGTGSFFVIALVGVLGYGFLEASAKAKIANLVTNLAALAVFAAHGTVLWGLGLTMGAANLLGGYLGARTADRARQRLRPQGLPRRRRRAGAQARLRHGARL